MTVRAAAADPVGGLRIGMVCPYSLSVPGGVQSQVLGLSRALRRRGHQVRVVAPCDGPPPALGVTPVGRSMGHATNGSVAPLAPDPATQIRTIRTLWDEGFDVTHIHEPLVPGPAQTAMLVKASPLVATFHASGDFSMYRAALPLARWALGRIDVRVAVSEDARLTAAEWFDGDYRILFNGVDTQTIGSADPWPTERPTILFVGRHEERKGLGVLLEALAHLPRSRRDLRVWVAGDGPLTAELRGRHGGDDRIQWLGRISDEERNRRLVGADLFCAPALGGESFGVVLLEAMAARTAVVASAIPGYTNVATHEVNALLAPPGDPRALAAQLARLLGGPDERDQLVLGGIERADRFSMERLAALYEELYRQARGTSRSSTAPTRRLRNNWWPGDERGAAVPRMATSMRRTGRSTR